MIPTDRRRQYARGFIDLGMVNEASGELEAIDWDDRMKLEFLDVRVDLYIAAKNWELAADISMHLDGPHPDQSQWWLHWAYVLRETDKTEEAKTVGLGVESREEFTAEYTVGELEA